MEIIMKFAIVNEDEKAATSPKLDAFKAEHKDLLADIKKLYDSTSEMLAEGCPDEDGHVPLDISAVPDFLGDLYVATLKLRLYIGTLESLLSEDQELLEQENFMEDLFELLGGAEDLLGLYNDAFAVALGYGDDNEDESDNDWDEGDVTSPVLARFRFDDDEFPEEDQKKAVDAAMEAIFKVLGLENAD